MHVIAAHQMEYRLALSMRIIRLQHYEELQSA
jgi:hypothetical protein